MLERMEPPGNPLIAPEVDRARPHRLNRWYYEREIARMQLELQEERRMVRCAEELRLRAEQRLQEERNLRQRAEERSQELLRVLAI